jgi:hypothetical protein
MPRLSSTSLIIAGSVTSPSTRSRPLHLGQTSQPCHSVSASLGIPHLEVCRLT